MIGSYVFTSTHTPNFIHIQIISGLEIITPLYLFSCIVHQCSPDGIHIEQPHCYTNTLVMQSIYSLCSLCVLSCVRVCMFVCVHVCLIVCMHVCVHVRMRECGYACVQCPLHKVDGRLLLKQLLTSSCIQRNLYIQLDIVI